MNIVLFPDFLFWVYFLIFIAGVFIAFFIPGDIFLKNYNFTFFQRLILGTCLGMIMWGWQGYIFGYLNIRWLSYVYLLIFGLLWIKSLPFNNKIKLSIKLKENLFFIAIILIGAIIQLSSVWFAGINQNNEIYFNSYSTPDNLWYLDLTSQVVKNVPPFEPGMFGKTIENYHYWASLVMGELIRVFSLPLIPTVSQYFAFLLSMFLGCTIIIFGQIFRLKKSIILWILFFIYFGGDFVNQIQLISTGKVDFSQQSMEDGAKFLANPPRAFALVLFFAGLNFIAAFIKNKKYSLGFIGAFVLGSLIGFKVYVGLFALTGLFFLALYGIFTRKYKFLLIFLLALCLSLLIYLPINSGAGGLIYVGFWRAQDFIVLPTLGLSRLELARQIFAEHGNWIKVYLYDLFFLIVLTIGTFGTKIAGLFQTKNTLKILPKELHIFLISGLTISFVLGTFFIQKSGGSNAFNFLVSAYVIGSIYTGIACWYWLGKLKSRSKYVFIVIIIALTVPRSMYQVVANREILHKGGSIVGGNELSALRYLSMETEPQSLILAQQGSTYLSFIANRGGFLYSEGVLYSHNVDFSDRVKTRDAIFNSGDVSLVASKLFENNINYIYKFSDPSFPLNKYKEFLNIVYENDSVQILKVDRDKLL